MIIRRFTPSDTGEVARIWNECSARGEMLYRPLTKAYFERKFLADPNWDDRFCLVAEKEPGKLSGFVQGCVKRVFLPGQNEANTPGYITVFFTDPADRGQGVATALLNAIEAAFNAAGKRKFMFVSTNPFNLDWVVPGTDGHEHNNAPGVDEECMGYAFLQKRGYAPGHREVAMYLNLKDYRKGDAVEEKRAALLRQGITAGLYDPKEQCEFDEMCTRVGSEYWRKVLKDELSSPAPRPILAARVNGHIVGFTGPVDRQANGRGWFTGICTDPLYEQRGIASVLFNDLMGEFIKVNAAYSTLFTGTDNHAQRLYLKTGFTPKRIFAIMTKEDP